jgi:alkylation response protein AidB-like acyl-CoA dehydrogenase
MRAEGVNVRPLRQITDETRFNEVFLDNVLVPDSHVVGDVNDGWRVARSTLGNERLNIGSGRGSLPVGEMELLKQYKEAGSPESLREPVALVVARMRACAAMNARRVARAMAGSEPGPEGSLTKLVTSEAAQEAAALRADLCELGEVALAIPGTPGGSAAYLLLRSRSITIAGGTAEITRNQVAERMLGMPRDPLIR